MTVCVNTLRQLHLLGVEGLQILESEWVQMEGGEAESKTDVFDNRETEMYDKYSVSKHHTSFGLPYLTLLSSLLSNLCPSLKRQRGKKWGRMERRRMEKNFQYSIRIWKQDLNFLVLRRTVGLPNIHKYDSIVPSRKTPALNRKKHDIIPKCRSEMKNVTSETVITI